MSFARFSKRFSRRQRRLGIALGIVGSLAAGVGLWRTLSARAVRPAPVAVTSTPVPLGPAPRPTTVVKFEDGCMTAECHADRLHVPVAHHSVAQGSCNECHKPDTGGHIFPLIGSKSELCGKCHDMGSRHPVQHKAMTDDGCLSCHGAHGGHTRALLNKPTSKEVCATCHDPAEGPVRHEPYANDRCETCHDVHGSNTRQLLATNSVEDSCRSCHPVQVLEITSAIHSHGTVKGSCIGCHSPHASDSKALLANPPGESCMDCHTELAHEVATATVSHDPVIHEDKCLHCHDPHATNVPGMLLKDQTSLCLSCHEKAVKSDDGRTIPAMDRLVGLDDNVPGHDTCASCHSVHGGKHAGLLNAALVQVPLGSYNRDNYALCFQCHDRRSVEKGGPTQFRDGDKNLHALHLSTGEKSIGCTTCHEVHAHSEPRLIAKSVRFEGSAWATPMGYEPTPDGGRCGAGCHEPLDYSRAPGGAKVKKGGGVP